MLFHKQTFIIIMFNSTVINNYNTNHENSLLQTSRGIQSSDRKPCVCGGLTNLLPTLTETAQVCF